MYKENEDTVIKKNQFDLSVCKLCLSTIYNSILASHKNQNFTESYHEVNHHVSFN